MSQSIYLVMQDYDDGESYITSVMGGFSTEGLAETYAAKLRFGASGTESKYYVEPLELNANIDHERVYVSYHSLPLPPPQLPGSFNEDWFVGPEDLARELPEDKVSVSTDQTRVHITCYRWSEEEVRAAADALRASFLLEWQQNHD